MTQEETSLIHLAYVMYDVDWSAFIAKPYRGDGLIHLDREATLKECAAAKKGRVIRAVIRFRENNPLGMPDEATLAGVRRWLRSQGYLAAPLKQFEFISTPVEGLASTYCQLTIHVPERQPLEPTDFDDFAQLAFQHQDISSFREHFFYRTNVDGPVPVLEVGFRFGLIDREVDQALNIFRTFKPATVYVATPSLQARLSLWGYQAWVDSTLEPSGFAVVLRVSVAGRR